MPDAVYEQRIAGKVVDVTCKHCRKSIRVDGTIPRSDAPAADSAANRPAAQTNSAESSKAVTDEQKPGAHKAVGQKPLVGKSASAMPAVSFSGTSKSALSKPSSAPAEPQKLEDLPSAKPAPNSIRPRLMVSKAPEAPQKTSLKIPLPQGSSSSGLSRAASMAPRVGASSGRVEVPANPLASSMLANAAVVPALNIKPKPEVTNESINLSVSDLLDPEGFDNAPTEITDRQRLPPRPPPRRVEAQSEAAPPKSAPEASAPKPPPPRRATGLKATMMGVAPPQAASGQKQEPVAPLRSASNSALAAVPVAELERPRTPEHREPTQQRPAGRKLPMGGTMLGLAPPSAAAGLELSKYDAASDPNAAREAVAAEPARSPHTEPLLQASVESGLAAANDVDAFSLAAEDEQSFELGPSSSKAKDLGLPTLEPAAALVEPTVALPNPLAATLALDAFQADDMTKVEPRGAAHAFTTDSVVGFRDRTTEVDPDDEQSAAPAVNPVAAPVISPAAMPSARRADESGALPQIAQSVPARTQPRRRRGYWLLVAIATLIGGLGGATVLVATGRVKLPEPMASLAARVLPGLRNATPSVTPPTVAAQQAPVVAPPIAAAPAALPAGVNPEPVPVAAGNPAASGTQLEGSAAASAPQTAEPAPSAAAVAAASASASVAEPAQALPATVVAAANEQKGAEAEQPATAEADKAQPAALEPPDTKGSGENAEAEPQADAPAPGWDGSPGPAVAEVVGQVPEGVDLPKLQYLMNLSMGRSRRCHLGGRATGKATVFATFGNDGHVSGVAVKGEPIESAPVASCIVTHTRSVSIKPFTGAPFTVKQGIVLR
jgi:hypothetical protein